jgi:hypothetical protein
VCESLLVLWVACVWCHVLPGALWVQQQPHEGCCYSHDKHGACYSRQQC